MNYLGTFKDCKFSMKKHQWYLVYSDVYNFIDSNKNKTIFMGCYSGDLYYTNHIGSNLETVSYSGGIMGVNSDKVFELTHEEIMNHVIIPII